MPNKIHKVLKNLNEIKHPASIFETTLITCTALSILFDIYQAFSSDQFIFSLISGVMVLIGTIGLLKCMTDAIIVYICVYLVPGILSLLGIFLKTYNLIGIDPSPYLLNATMSSLSVIFPPITAFAASIFIPPISVFLKRLELKLGSRHK